MILSLFLSLVLSNGNAAVVPEAAKPNIDEFRALCRLHREGGRALLLKSPTPGQVTYLPPQVLDATQYRFSFNSVLRKMRKALKYEPNAYFDKKQDKWIVTHDQGRSFFPAHKYIKGIFYRGRVYITDGHHRAIISTYLGAKTIPVKILADWSSRFSQTQFLEYMENHHLSYFHDFNGHPSEHVDLCEMVDDPNLELARRLIGRVDLHQTDHKLTIDNVRGPKWVIGLKSQDDIPFLENEVADALHREGVLWSPTVENLSKEDLREYLAVLTKARETPESRLRYVLLLDRPARMADLAIEKLMRDHLQMVNCEEILKSRP